MSAYPIGSPSTTYTNGFAHLSNGNSSYNGSSQQLHTNGNHMASNAGALGYTNGSTPISPAASGGDIQSLWDRYGQLRLETVRKDMLIEVSYFATQRAAAANQTVAAASSALEL